MTARPLVMTLVLEDSLASLAEKLGTAVELSGGNCQPEDSDLFFSEKARDVASAIAICSTCPIKKRCLQAAVDSGEIGVWGGTTYAEREPMVANLGFAIAIITSQTGLMIPFICLAWVGMGSTPVEMVLTED